jgi:hypothetical protein
MSYPLARVRSSGRRFVAKALVESDQFVLVDLSKAECYLR